ncbi:MAG: FadR family transcriptional regulator [Sphingomonas bacterium]|uniref:FadR/GntR family transcriptional regulator n=1 Tax=Sphingomonas bacterium TaxID=1895847 RepID=UPI002606CEFE|nr:FCD domain-containing protein [Sphingomonas bacterium]MDB5703862.1 FadR family transcriptional regulator [Sphingomonas bacterium]
MAAVYRRPTKTSEIIALEIVRHIVDRDLGPGDRLPLEAEMLTRYRVSRSSLREALRLLEVQGMIAIRPGPGAGTVVGEVLPGNLGRTLTLYLNMMGANYDELLQTWVTTEPVLARLAAQNPDREKSRRLLAPFLTEEGQDNSHELTEGVNFHQVVGELSGNRVLAFVFQAVSLVVAEHLLLTNRSRQMAPKTVHDHTAIARAIVAGHADKAEQLMVEHVRAVVENCRTLWPQQITETVEWR